MMDHAEISPLGHNLRTEINTLAPDQVAGQLADIVGFGHGVLHEMIETQDFATTTLPVLAAITEAVRKIPVDEERAKTGRDVVTVMREAMKTVAPDLILPLAERAETVAQFLPDPHTKFLAFLHLSETFGENIIAGRLPLSSVEVLITYWQQAFEAERQSSDENKPEVLAILARQAIRHTAGLAAPQGAAGGGVGQELLEPMLQSAAPMYDEALELANGQPGSERVDHVKHVIADMAYSSHQLYNVSPQLSHTLLTNSVAQLGAILTDYETGPRAGLSGDAKRRDLVDLGHYMLGKITTNEGLWQMAMEQRQVLVQQVVKIFETAAGYAGSEPLTSDRYVDLGAISLARVAGDKLSDGDFSISQAIFQTAFRLAKTEDILNGRQDMAYAVTRVVLNVIAAGREQPSPTSVFQHYSLAHNLVSEHYQASPETGSRWLKDKAGDFIYYLVKARREANTSIESPVIEESDLPFARLTVEVVSGSDAIDYLRLLQAGSSDPELQQMIEEKITAIEAKAAKKPEPRSEIERLFRSLLEDTAQ